jgi:PhnB protein
MALKPHIYLSFNGQCEAAFKAYEKILGGKTESFFTWGGSPIAADAPPEWASKVMHATLSVGGTVIAGADVPPERYERPQGFNILLGMDDPREAERIFQALAEGGTVTMPLEKTFWALRFGALTDRFGIPWSINCEQAAEN